MKSERSTDDASAPMGMAATNTIERILASVGAGNAQEPSFQPAIDLENGGVLLALPALLAMGLLRHTKNYFSLPKGYYGIESIFLLLAFMALCRVKSMESLRYLPPGEWGKLLGLDRIPEVKTLREKLANLASQGTETQWSTKLCNGWNRLLKMLAFYILMVTLEFIMVIKQSSLDTMWHEKSSANALPQTTGSMLLTVNHFLRSIRLLTQESSKLSKKR